MTVLAVGRLKERYFRDAEAEYAKRLRPYCALAIRELRDDAALAAAVPDRARLVALDERGDAIDSRAFAEQFLSGGDVAFAIGGADGHAPELLRRADHRIAFGRMTIAHRLVRIVLLEQIYRGFRIARGEPYHRD